jgi:REP element-mobilizing transposase RayT
MQETKRCCTYLITFTCYGTWLHGDSRGSVDRKHNIPGTPFVPENSERLKAIRTATMKQESICFNEEHRQVVDQTIREVCDHKQWELLAINVRTNHVHTVVTAEDKPEIVMNYFKRYASRRLHEQHMFAKETTLWTRHGSTRYLNDQKSIDAAVQYVLEGQ